jgi:hypothetical protein
MKKMSAFVRGGSKSPISGEGCKCCIMKRNSVLVYFCKVRVFFHKVAIMSLEGMNGLEGESWTTHKLKLYRLKELQV